MAAFACTAAALAQPVADVKVTPLGSHDGELCPQDRALVFEDPSGTRILFDPGRTVTGPNDPRLGKIDVILVTHMHGDTWASAQKARTRVVATSRHVSVGAAQFECGPHRLAKKARS